MTVFVKELSEGKYIARKVSEYGLVAKRDCPACACSPDGVFPLLKKDENDGSTKFLSLCALEIKTRSALGTVNDLYRQTLNSGKWTECDAGTEEFKLAVPDNAYRTQICQHAAALGLEYVMLAYCLPGGMPKRLVLVHVSAAQQDTLVKPHRKDTIDKVSFG